MPWQLGVRIPSNASLTMVNNMKRKTKIIFSALAILIATALIAGAALLTHFGQVTTTATVLQSIVISDDGINWKDYDEPIDTAITDMVHCTPHWFKYHIRNRACADADVYFDITWLDAPNGDPTGYELANWILGDEQTIQLTFKGTDWQPLPGLKAYLTIPTCSENFYYHLEFTCESEEQLLIGPQYDYGLIYYIDQDPRFDAWGKYMFIDTVALGYDKSNDFEPCTIPAMPFIDDWNAVIGGYTYEAEGYNHIQGAKFWLVPLTQLSTTTPGEVGEMATWTHDDYMFETDLGLYVKCDGILNYPHIYDIFQTHTLKSETTYCWLNYNHVPMDIMPGTYQYLTYLKLGFVR